MNGMNEHFYERDLENEKDELKKEVAALRRALKSHGEIMEENNKLRKERAAIDEIYSLFLEDFEDVKNHSTQVIRIVSKVRKSR